MPYSRLAASAVAALLLVMLGVAGVSWPTGDVQAIAHEKAPSARSVAKSDIALYDEVARKAVRFAQQQVGKPYIAGMRGPNAYDCSGLTWAAWHQAGLDWPMSMALSYYQWNPKGFGLDAMWTLPVAPGEERPGDLVFFDWYHNPQDAPRGLSGPAGVDHVGIVEDSKRGIMIEAANPNAGVIRSSYRDGANAARLIGFARIMPKFLKQR